MHPHKLVLRWLVRAQIFTLIVLVFMPALLHALGEMLGKLVFFLMVVIAIGLSWILDRLLGTIE